MKQVWKRNIIAMVIVTFLLGQVPQVAQAGTDTITKNEPQVLTTPEESLKVSQDEKVGGGKLLWIIVGTLAIGGLAVGLGGGGGGSSAGSSNNNTGSVTTSW